MKIHTTIFFTSLMLLHFNSISQVNDFTRDPDTGLFKEVSSTGWIKFADQVNVKPDQVFEIFKTSFGLTTPFQMKIAKSREDELGFTHIKYHQYLDQIRIKGGDYIIHGKEGRSVSGNGKIITPENIQSGIAWSESAALASALNQIHAKKYYWQDPAKEFKARTSKKSSHKTYYPQSEWIYVWDDKNDKLILTYSFHIYTIDPGKSGNYFVDAMNGNIIEMEPAEHNCNETTFVSNWYGVMTLWTNEEGDYDLEDDCQESVYGVYDIHGFMFSTPDNNWIGPLLGSCAQSLISIKWAYLSFYIAFTRLGHDDNDGDLDITQGYDFGPPAGNNNASYTYDPIGNDDIRVGIGDHWDVLDDFNTIDILAHEYTHGVTEYEADLDYEFESGALDESFSDIFGEWVEFKVFGTNNWLIGNDRIVGSCPDPLRYMVDPGGLYSVPPCFYDFDQPNTYHGQHWFELNGCDPDDENDDCGVHTNSGVQNQMFYLLSQGGAGWNNGMTCHAPANTGYPWSVTGIGINDAGRIAYRVLVDYLIPTSNYADSRNAWVHAAEDLFGPCSFQAIQTGRAWYAVGIGPPASGTMTLCNVTYGNTPQLIATPDIIETQLGCFVNIANTGNLVEFSSGSKVHLQAGFHATWGSNFNTTITDCIFANY